MEVITICNTPAGQH